MNCSKCGQPVIGGDIGGHETEQWHIQCPPLPTTDKEDEHRFRVALNKLVDDDNMPEALALVASSNHQAVQAFGEKVLREKQMMWGSPFLNRSEVVPVSVITSLMKGEVK